MSEKWIDDFYNCCDDKPYKLNNVQKNMLEKNAPQTLFQYRPINDCNISNIKNNVVWARKASKFNDPYDCWYSTVQFDMRIDEMKASGAGFFVQELEDMKMAFEKEGNNIRNHTAVSCFSEKNDSLLMWSHYADQHKGMCVEYDYKELKRVSREDIYPVSYGEKIDVLKKDKNSIRQPTFMVLVRKAPEWSYEHEWRILPLLVDDYTEGIVIKTPKPQKIILGSQVDLNDIFIQSFVRELTSRGINCTKMMLDKEYFRLREADILRETI